MLRAAGLAADHEHRPRAVFQRLDGSMGEVQRTARLIQDEELRLDTPGGHFAEVDLADEARTAHVGPWETCFNCGSTGPWKKCGGESVRSTEACNVLC